MTEENKIKCPMCNSENIGKIKDTVCFDEVIYRNICRNCGHKFD